MSNQTANVELTRPTRATVAIYFLIFLCPFIQLGYDYWASAQGLAFVVVLVAVKKRLPIADLGVCGLIAVIMLIAVLLRPDAAFPIPAFAHCVFQALGLTLIICAAKDEGWIVPAPNFQAALSVLIFSLFVLTAAQLVSYALLHNPRFFVPERFFVTGQATNALSWLEFGKAHGFLTSIRVSATYSEPSYLGFVLMCLAMLVLKGNFKPLTTAVLLTTIVVTATLSKSASSIIMISALMLIAYRRRVRWGALLGIVLILGCLIGVGSTVLGFDPIGRVLRVTDPRLEPSGYIRLVMPLRHIAVVLRYAPLGVPHSEAYSFFSQHMESYYSMMRPVDQIGGGLVGEDNGLFNLLIDFGWGGFLVIALLIFVLRDGLSLMFLLFVSQFNGAPLSPDKVAMICMVFAHRNASSAGTIGNESVT
jgi:hypothetical protein